jgi:hypothetical protein
MLLVAAIALPLLLPVLVPAEALPPRRQVYSAIPWSFGPYAWIERQIFDERTPVDIVFAGASHIWSAIDPPTVQAAIEQHRAGPASVLTLGWTGAGYDSLYFMMKDLLDHRRVKLLVVNDELEESRDVHAVAYRWYRYADEPEALAALPARSAVALYAAAVLGMPRNLYARLMPTERAEPLGPTYWEREYRADPVGARGGSLTSHLAYLADPTGFQEFSPKPPVRALVFSPATQSRFTFQRTAANPYQRVFLERAARLAQERGTTLVFLDLPALAERSNNQVTEQMSWPTELPGDVRLVGVPPAELFGGLSDEEVRRLYFDDKHFNVNGQRYFTAATVPALVELLDD